MIWKICLHWTAGTYRLSTLDYQHYHWTVGEDGQVDKGLLLPEANIPPLRNGKYVAHCGGGNSYCIGLAARGMAGFKNAKQVGKYPITRKQGEALWKLAAEKSREYGIVIEPETVFTHYEFGKRNPKTESAGKIDIIHLPYEPFLKANEMGDCIRDKVRWYRGKL